MKRVLALILLAFTFAACDDPPSGGGDGTGKPPRTWMP